MLTQILCNYTNTCNDGEGTLWGEGWEGGEEGREWNEEKINGWIYFYNDNNNYLYQCNYNIFINVVCVNVCMYMFRW